MTTRPQRRRVRVLESCPSEQVQEIRVRAGDNLAVGPTDETSGVEGWLPASCMHDLEEAR
jgi:hypothetical protein